jgi:hypothetical protein
MGPPNEVAACAIERDPLAVASAGDRKNAGARIAQIAALDGGNAFDQYADLLFVRISQHIRSSLLLNL